VIPTPEQLEEISRLREGTLQEVPFAAMLLAFATHRRTLMVEVRRKQISKKIVLEHGVPVDCRSNLVHETLSRYLVAEGKLAAEDLHVYLGESVSRGLPFGEVLLEHDQITAEDLFRMLQQNLAKKLLDVFTWRDGEFRTHEEVPRPESPLKIRVPQLVVTGITKFASQEEVEAGVVPLIGKRLVLHPNPPFALDEIRLNPRQSQVAVALRSGWRIDELALGTGVPFEEITRLLYALAMLGVVITADHPAARSVPRAAQPAAAAAPATAPATPTAAAAGAALPGMAPPASPAAAAPRPQPGPGIAAPATPAPAAGAVSGAPTAPAGPASPATPADPAGPAGLAAAAGTAEAAERRRNEVMQAYLSYRRLDAFDLLGADEDASPAAVEVKYLEFARRFAPWTFDGPDFAGMEEKARDIFLAGAHAYAELLDLERRNTLLFRRRARREERDRRPPADLLAIKTDLLDPEVQYRKGRALADAGKFQEAVMLLEFASDCDPQNGLYGAELAYCRFCLAPGQGERALKELQETLRLDPDCGLAVFYAGEIHRQMGHHADAEKLLRRAIKLMTPDRRPIEALKLLAAEKRR
jgi:tetratricopeptide (TPR) repeat protein